MGASVVITEVGAVVDGRSKYDTDVMMVTVVTDTNIENRNTRNIFFCVCVFMVLKGTYIIH